MRVIRGANDSLKAMLAMVSEDAGSDFAEAAEEIPSAVLAGILQYTVIDPSAHEGNPDARVGDWNYVEDNINGLTMFIQDMEEQFHIWIKVEGEWYGVYLAIGIEETETEETETQEFILNAATVNGITPSADRLLDFDADSALEKIWGDLGLFFEMQSDNYPEERDAIRFLKLSRLMDRLAIEAEAPRARVIDGTARLER